MTGVSLSVDFNDQAARERLNDLLKRMANPLKFYSAVGDEMVRSTHLRFVSQVSPSDAPWTPLKQSTIRRRIAQKQTPIQILRSNGRSNVTLSGSISAAPSDSQVEVGASVPYARIHQLGGDIERPARQGKIYRGASGSKFVKRKKAKRVADVEIPAYTIHIPARPYLGVSAQDEVKIIRIAERWLAL